MAARLGSYPDGRTDAQIGLAADAIGLYEAAFVVSRRGLNGRLRVPRGRAPITGPASGVPAFERSDSSLSRARRAPRGTPT